MARALLAVSSVLRNAQNCICASSGSGFARGLEVHREFTATA